jgi:hypothetical protein
MYNKNKNTTKITFSDLFSQCYNNYQMGGGDAEAGDASPEQGDDAAEAEDNEEAIDLNSFF